MDKPTSWVYFVQAGENGPIKIGFTAGDPSTRMGALQTGNPERLRLLVAINAGQPKEIELHKRFAALRMAGEWFRPEPALLGFIEALQWSSDVEQYEIPAVPMAYGLCEEQVRVIVGYMRARQLFDRADGVEEHFRGRAKLDGDEYTHLVKLHGAVAYMLEKSMSSESECPEDDGARMFGGLPLMASLDKVRNVLANHGFAIAEEQLAEDGLECADPESIAADRIDSDWDPFVAGPVNDPGGLN